MRLPDPLNIMPYMTVIPHRRPVQKLHTTLAHARNALAVARFRYDKVDGGRLYKWTGDKWELLHEIAEGTHRDELPWRKSA